MPTLTSWKIDETMMKRLLMSLAAILVTPNDAIAQQWTLLGASGNTTFYYDRASVRKDGATNRLWVLEDLRTPDQRGRRSYKTAFEVDCRGSRIRRLQQHTFMGQMGTGTVVDGPLVSEEWRLVPTGTVLAALQRAACQ